MFNNKEDDYYNAVKHAQVYTSKESTLKSKKRLILNFAILALLAYLTFSYLQKSNNLFSLSNFKQGVLGVSETIDEVKVDNERLMEILKTSEVSADNLQNSMKVLVNEPSIQSKSSYTEAIARELDDKSGFKGRIAVVNNPE